MTSTVLAAGPDPPGAGRLTPWRAPMTRHDPAKVLATINTARAAARARVWTAAGANAHGHPRDGAQPLVIDIDATSVTAHSEKENAAPTFKPASWRGQPRRCRTTAHPIDVAVGEPAPPMKVASKRSATDGVVGQRDQASAIGAGLATPAQIGRRSARGRRTRMRATQHRPAARSRRAIT
jgi:hypothetical protein